VTGAGEPPDLAELAGALAELTEVVRQQGELLGRIAIRLGIEEGEADLHQEASAARDDVLWQRLGLVEGERRNVTVLFADVSGFTALSERLDAEEFQLVMKDTMSAIAGVINRYDGHIEKFIGDAVCAIFGAPIAHDDEPQRAARSALEINRVLVERAAARPDLPALGMHAGINTGIVIAGTVGDGSQFGVMGDTINTASRLMNLAAQDEIFVSAETARRLRREFHLEDRGTFEVKGKQHPIAAFNLVAEHAEVEHGVDRLEAPFVDREAELAQLRSLSDQAASSHGAVALVVGEPGVGKTRLVNELVKAEAGRFRVIRGSARVVGEQPLGVLVAAIRSELDSLADGPEKDVVTAALHHDGAALPPDFELTLARVLAASALQQPLLFVLDDIESADRGSLELTRYLARATSDVPIFWMLAARWAPPMFDAAAGDDDLITVQLRPLDEDDMAELLEGLLPGVFDRAQRARLAYQADGNPEFAEEIVLSLLDEGVVTETGDGGYRLIGDPDTVEIPSSVAELVEARMDRVATDARITLQDAAVIGLRFRRTLLAAVATVSDALDAALAELSAVELIIPPGDLDDPDAYWTFRSHVIREVAYDSILRRRRPRLHRAVADALQRLEPEHSAENVELIASHYELSDEPALAIPFLRRAIEDAEASHSITGSADRARRALSIRERAPDAVESVDAAWFLEHLGIARLMLGDRSGLDDLEAAAELYRPQGDVAEETGLEERVRWYLARADERGDPSVAVGVRAVLAEMWRERGDAERACALATEAVEIATERSVAVDAAAEAYLARAMVALDRGEPANEPIDRLAQLVEQDPSLGRHLEPRLELVRARAAGQGRNRLAGRGKN
jgi:adenylate cyclase